MPRRDHLRLRQHPQPRPQLHLHQQLRLRLRLQWLRARQVPQAALRDLHKRLPVLQLHGLHRQSASPLRRPSTPATTPSAARLRAPSPQQVLAALATLVLLPAVQACWWGMRRSAPSLRPQM